MLIQKFIKGYETFQENVFPKEKETFAKLADGQQPPVLLITCSDSRIVPNLVLQADPGELFMLRNAGNIVPPYGPNMGAEAAAIEYAVAVLKVKHIVVCGHSKCGAMGAVMDPGSVEALPAVKAWVQYATAARSALEGESGEKSLERLIERNVMLQVDHLLSHPAVAKAVAANELHLHGWVYKFETGEMVAHDRATGRFKSLREVEGASS